MPDTQTWTWSHEGVTLEENQLLWFQEMGPVSFAGGSAGVQSFADFLTNGPMVERVPPEVVTELRAAILARRRSE